MTSISHSEFVNTAKNKETLYKTMAYQSKKYDMLISLVQFWLPPIRMCSALFMTQILSGKKKVFKNHEIVLCKLESRKFLSIGTILERIKDNTFALNYLPDDPANYMTRDYLIGIVNTLDKTFFTRLLEEVETKSTK